MIKLNIYKGRTMRRISIGDLPFTFTDRVDWDIKPMVKIRRVTEKYKKKKVTEFYGELVEFEDTGLWLMLPAQEIAELGSRDIGYGVKAIIKDGEIKTELVEEVDEYIEIDRLTIGMSNVKVKKGDYFLGKMPITITNIMRLQGNTTVIIQFMELKRS